MVSPIKSILGQNPLKDLIGYETKADLAIFTITLLSFYLFIYPNFQTWNKKQLKTVLTASTPYLGTIAILSSISAKTGTPKGLTALVAVGIIIFTASINHRSKIKNLKGLYPEITLGTILISVVASFTKFPSLYDIVVLLGLSITALILVFAFFYILDIQRDKLILLPIWSHFIDASSTVIALNNSLSESRLLANIFIQYLGPYGIFLMKALIIIPLTFFAVRNLDEKHSLFALYVISALGLILGVRNILLI
jgi:uncharacterized membrane protein